MIDWMTVTRAVVHEKRDDGRLGRVVGVLRVWPGGGAWVGRWEGQAREFRLTREDLEDLDRRSVLPSIGGPIVEV